jgi:DNA-binding beta-propeller fold protein YncE
MHPITLNCNPIGDVAADPAGTTLVVTHPRDSAVSILDVEDPAAVSLIGLDGDPVAVAAAGGRAFVATTSASYDAVHVLEPETTALVSAHPLAFSITSMAASADGTRVFVARTGRLGNDVAVVDIATQAVTPVAIATSDVAIIDVVRAGASGMLYLGISSPRDGELAVVDGAEGRLVAAVTVGAPIRDVALSPDGAVAYVLAQHPRGAAAVIRIDTANNAIRAVVKVSEFATQLTVSSDGANIYVVEPNGVTVICAATDEIFDHITVGGWPSCVPVCLPVGSTWPTMRVSSPACPSSRRRLQRRHSLRRSRSCLPSQLLSFNQRPSKTDCAPRAFLMNTCFIADASREAPGRFSCRC